MPDLEDGGGCSGPRRHMGADQMQGPAEPAQRRRHQGGGARHRHGPRTSGLSPGAPIASQTFVGQPVQDLHSHGTHCIGTACGPQSPAGTTPRYGIAFKAADLRRQGAVQFRVGRAGGSVLAGMNWAIANRCAVISMSLGGQIPVQPAYTAAGQSALNNGCLIIAAAGNAGSTTGAPANSPTIMSVASLDPNLQPFQLLEFRQDRDRRARPRRLLLRSAADALRHQERNQHGDAACGGLRRAVGRNQPELARHESLEQTAGNGATSPVPGFAGRQGAGAGAEPNGAAGEAETESLMAKKKTTQKVTTEKGSEEGYDPEGCHAGGRWVVTTSRRPRDCRDRQGSLRCGVYDRSNPAGDRCHHREVRSQDGRKGPCDPRRDRYLA